MNLYIKYCPLCYTIRTRLIPHKIETRKDGSRIHHTLNNWKINLESISYLYYQVFIRIFPIFAIYFSWVCDFLHLLMSFLLYIYNYIVFLIFYEIWYLYNDLQWREKEKAPTLYINYELSRSFYYNNIIIRVFLWWILLLLLYFFDHLICMYFALLLAATQVVFYIHNTIRKYFYNRITIFLLRFLKMSQIFIPMYLLLWTFDSDFYLYTATVFLIWNYFTSFLMYSNRFWFEEKNLWMPYSLLQHWYNTLSMFILFAFTKNYVFLIYGIIYFLLFIKTTPKHYFRLKNDR